MEFSKPKMIKVSSKIPLVTRLNLSGSCSPLVMQREREKNIFGIFSISFMQKVKLTENLCINWSNDNDKN